MGYVPGENHLPPSCDAVIAKAQELQSALCDSGNTPEAMAVVSMSALYSGWWANRTRILAEREANKRVDEANKRARRAEADRDERGQSFACAAVLAWRAGRCGRRWHRSGVPILSS